MRKSCLLFIGTLLLVLAGYVTRIEAEVNINVGVHLPAISFAVSPHVVVIPGTYVYMVPDGEKTCEGLSEKTCEGHSEKTQEGHSEKTQEGHSEKTPEVQNEQKSQL